MEYDVQELAAAAGLSVDTIRYYQARGLLAPPARRGRRAVYGEAHRRRLARIREFSERGYSLRSIAELVAESGPEVRSDVRLKAALREGQPPARYTRKQFAATLGVPQALLLAVEQTGLAVPQHGPDGEPRYTDADLAAARGALTLLERGLPLAELLELAVRHHRTVAETVERAIDLFDEYVRKRAAGRDREEPDKVAEAYREIMPVVTALVAHHFQRVLVNRALERLHASGERRNWRAALKATATGHLEVAWR
jgi:DNA-binding transcriptional MerR regulator